MSETRIGQTVGGHYQIQSKIGEGGQSIVYKGLDTRTGREVAVKIMHHSIAEDAHARERMNREWEALRSLAAAPAALAVYEQCWTDDDCMCLVTELLNGMDLDDYLSHKGDKLSVPEVILLLEPIVDTLEAAHALGVVHRDLKPGNIFVVREPSGVRLLDFGFAKFTKLHSFTVAGSVAGSPRYIAPEAWMGRRDLDARIDVYAVGALIFRCLAGRTPFEADTMLMLLRAVTEAPRPSLHALRPDLPRDVDEWLQLALAIDRDARFQNVRALWNAFIGIVC